MARRKANPDQKLRAWELYDQENGPTAVLEALTREYPDPVTARTVATWVGEFKELPDETKDLDSLFEWHLMDKFGLPWDASDFLLEMWAMVEEFGIKSCQGFDLPKSTFRRARWWWRVYKADPSLLKQDIWFLAERFVLRERLNEVAGEPLYLADLEAHLAYKPWMNEKMLSRYREAIEREPKREIRQEEQFLLYPIRDSGDDGAADNRMLYQVGSGWIVAPELPPTVRKVSLSDPKQLPFDQVLAEASRIGEEHQKNNQ